MKEAPQGFADFLGCSEVPGAFRRLRTSDYGFWEKDSGDRVVPRLLARLAQGEMSLAEAQADLDLREGPLSCG